MRPMDDFPKPYLKTHAFYFAEYTPPLKSCRAKLPYRKTTTFLRRPVFLTRRI